MGKNVQPTKPRPVANPKKLNEFDLLTASELSSVITKISQIIKENCYLLLPIIVLAIAVPPELRS